jgi:mono/diheme cytochrome c family protein
VEYLVVRILQLSLFLLVAAVAISGCAPPDPSFASNAKTGLLVAEVREAVRQEVDDKFGRPNHPVAWLRMGGAVDFGTLVGKVEGFVEDGDGTYRLQVSFEENEGAPSPDQVEFAGLGLVWKSGAYANGSQIDGGQRDGERLFALQVASFDVETSLLTLRQRMEPPPASGETGDTFEIVGYKLASGRQLYATHCQHCHGTSGDGNGPTAKYLNPRPRDYRLGKFKFKSTIREDRPSDDDLERIIRKGIPGTYMPSFLLLEDGELDAIVEYVKWLAIRGEYELQLVNLMSGDFAEAAFDERVETSLKKQLEQYDSSSGQEKPTRKIVRQQFFIDESRDFAHLAELAIDESEFLRDVWLKVQAADSAVLPTVARTPDTHESRAKGLKLFMKNCAACHGATGRGDGVQVEDYMVDAETREKFAEPGLFDDWGHLIKPRDLTRGIYRGGRRPVDLYRRVHEGINGTPMMPFKATIPDAEIWDLVNYVYHIPFESRGESTKKSPAKNGRTAASTLSN